MKIKLSQHTPIKAKGTTIIPKVIILNRKITLKDRTEKYLNTDALHVMKENNFQKIVPRIIMDLTRRRTTKEDIMLTLQRMMNLPKRESNKKVMILQVMKNMFLFLGNYHTLKQ